LPAYSQWRPIGIVTMSHGYGLSVTPLQLAHAYATIGAFGIARPVSFLRVEAAAPGERALETQVCRELLGMLGRWCRRRHRQARGHPGLPRIGKTGTAWKATAGGYSTDRYNGGVRRGGSRERATPGRSGGHRRTERRLHMGGQVAAPVFSKVIGGALRLLAVAPISRQRARGTAGQPRLAPRARRPLP